jgi:steroid 5-alpha reductase family enzyme
MSFENLPEQLLAAWLLNATLMALLWCYARAIGKVTIVDVGWSAGTGLTGLFFAATTPGPGARHFLVAAMLGLWSLRLATHLFLDRVWHREEDGRYRSLRKRWGARADNYFFIFFQVQALLAWLFALPALAAMRVDRPALDLLDCLGIAIWGVSIFGESLADFQLQRFRAAAEHRGRTCRDGLWRYSRHPNYFFEWLHWWTYVPMSLGVAAWWATLLAPALMLYFLFRVTGIPATEAQAVQSRGADYQRYQQTTSAFFPWFPRREQS